MDEVRHNCQMRVHAMEDQYKSVAGKKEADISELTRKVNQLQETLFMQLEDTRPKCGSDPSELKLIIKDLQ